MARYCPENEKIKRAYATYLEAANGKQSATIDAALKALQRFEESTGRKPFSRFHIEQARAFRRRLADEAGPSGKPLSAATVTSTLRALRGFFLWLSCQPGYRSKLNPTDANYFTPSEQDRRIAAARREGHVASIQDIGRVLAVMPHRTPIERRDRALIAFALLSGARDGALATFRLKHVDLEERTVFHDGRDVASKRRKTFTAHFFPVGGDALAIFADYLAMLTGELAFSPDDPLFPATKIGHGADNGFAAIGLSRVCWTTAEPIRRIFRAAFAAAGLPYANPHSFRKTLARLGERLCRTPEEWKAWSQNLGHESEATTFASYGQVPTHRQTEIMAGLGQERLPEARPESLVGALEAALQLARAGNSA